MVYPVIELIRLKIGFPFPLLLLLLLLLLPFFVDPVAVDIPAAVGTNFYLNSRCNFTVNYTTGSVFQENIGRLFSTLRKEAPPVLFANATAGQGSERVYGLVQCRGDFDQDTCNVCITNATLRVVDTYCPYVTDAIIWYEKCQLRYSNTNFFGRLNVNDSGNWYWASGDVDNPKVFHEKLGGLLKNLTSIATTEPSSRFMFATGKVPNTETQTVYGLVQCTMDISPAVCEECLGYTIISKLQATCGNAHGCEIATGSCRVRFDTELFYLSTTTPSPSPSSIADLPTTPPSPSPASNTTSGQQKTARRKPGFIIIVISGLLVVLITCIICGFYWWKRQLCCFRRKKFKPDEFDRKEEESLEQQAFKRADSIDGPILDLATVRFATNYFAPVNKLGEGGFGAVYRGKLPHGQEIAVKRFSGNAKHGPKQFDNEVRTLAKLQHRNLVRLLGGFIESEEIILIYDYVRNASLDKFLFGESTKRMQLDWGARSKLINGIARGLLYLHEDSLLRIVHRDLKASNVLLDEDMNPKISDFGTAKIFEIDHTQTHTMDIVGTRGYMAPEYLLEGKVSVKIDVYSFGVLLLEIISGKRNSFTQEETDENLLCYVWKLWEEKKALEVVDQILEGAFVEDEILRFVHIGLLCAQEDASSRPRMSKVVAMLENSSLILPPISPPAPPIWKIRKVSSRPQPSSTTSTSAISSELGTFT